MDAELADYAGEYNQSEICEQQWTFSIQLDNDMKLIVEYEDGSPIFYAQMKMDDYPQKIHLTSMDVLEGIQMKTLQDQLLSYQINVIKDYEGDGFMIQCKYKEQIGSELDFEILSPIHIQRRTLQQLIINEVATSDSTILTPNLLSQSEQQMRFSIVMQLIKFMQITYYMEDIDEQSNNESQTGFMEIINNSNSKLKYQTTKVLLYTNYGAGLTASIVLSGLYPDPRENLRYQIASLELIYKYQLALELVGKETLEFKQYSFEILQSTLGGLVRDLVRSGKLFMLNYCIKMLDLPLGKFQIMLRGLISQIQTGYIAQQQDITLLSPSKNLSLKTGILNLRKSMKGKNFY